MTKNNTMKSSAMGITEVAVMESINATHGQETQEIGICYGLFRAVTEIAFNPSDQTLNFWAKKCSGFGITSQETLETAVK